MADRDFMTEDSRATLLVCSSLGLDATSDAGLIPFTLTEWNKLAGKIESSSLKRPAELFGRSAKELAEKLELSADEGARIAELLARSSAVALHLETLRSQGIWAVTRADDRYPARLRQRLKHKAPTVLFGSGEIELLNRGGIAVVGSRNIDDTGTAFAQRFGRKCAEGKIPVVSGGARGTDRLAMQAAIEAGGVAFGVLADSIERTVRQPDVRQMLLDSQLVLLTPYAPAAGFSVGAAMGRNKLIYGLADYAIVVSSEFNKGGTWAGAVEALKAGLCPVVVRIGASIQNGNRELLKRGAVVFEETILTDALDLTAWLSRRPTDSAGDPELFPDLARDQFAKYP